MYLVNRDDYQFSRTCAIHHGAGLAVRVNFGDRMQVPLRDSKVNRVSIHRDHEISMRGRIGQRHLPKSLRVRRLLPGSVIAFVNRAPQRYVCFLYRARVIA